MDNVSQGKRSETMSRIRNKDSKIEKFFCKELWELGFRYRKNSSKYFGKPDIVLKSSKTVIFIDSCFWHGCKYHCRIPSVRKFYWVEKISRNKIRDKNVSKYYKKLGWNIFRVWEHSIKNNNNVHNIIVNKLIGVRRLARNELTG